MWHICYYFSEYLLCKNTLIILLVLWEKYILAPQTTTISPDGPPNYQGFHSSLPNYQLPIFLAPSVNLCHLNGWKWVMCYARDLTVYKFSNMPFSLNMKLLDFPFGKISWRPQYYENAIRVGVVQLDLKMHSSTPWVCSRLLLIIHEHSHFHRQCGFVCWSPAHVHREMNGIKLSLASTAWKFSTSPGISGPSQYITQPPATCIQFSSSRWSDCSHPSKATLITIDLKKLRGWWTPSTWIAWHLCSYKILHVFLFWQNCMIINNKDACWTKQVGGWRKFPSCRIEFLLNHIRLATSELSSTS